MVTDSGCRPVSPETSTLSSSLSDAEFVELCYSRFLHRSPDKVGGNASLQGLAEGLPRFDFVASLVSSPEYYKVLTKQIFGAADLPNLQQLKPEKFDRVSVSYSAEPIMTFRVDAPVDYDWLETMILDHGYYERPGVWSLAIDIDKRIIAEVIGHFAPKRILEIGCATGPVLKLLREMAIEAEGIEISHMAHALAYREVKKQIHFGDILNLPLQQHYDMIVGMDVFEHLNPNKMQRYLQRCYNLLVDGGFLFTNIPAFGSDRIFGELFPIYLPGWDADAEDKGLFSLLHVNEAGWPLNGHLAWATTNWWERHFQHAGFERETKIERALHTVYDGFFDTRAPARKSLFVFSKRCQPMRTESVTKSVYRNKSEVLDAALGEARGPAGGTAK
jgi:SAM-dependent methyltransferase